jgi:hypothetical protein
MNLPGFTAEASLHRPARPYASVCTTTLGAGRNQVVLSAFGTPPMFEIIGGHFKKVCSKVCTESHGIEVCRWYCTYIWVD